MIVMLEMLRKSTDRNDVILLAFWHYSRYVVL